MRRAGLILPLLLLAGAPPAAEPQEEALARRVEAVLRDPEYQAAYWAVEVRSLATGERLYSHNASRSLQPASTLKLVTTAAAIDVLGPERRFATTVETAARVDEGGRLLGDLYLVGGGDPGLSKRYEGDPVAALDALAGAVRAAGVRRIEGRLVGHEGLFETERRPEGWDWDDLVWWYGAEISALSFHDSSADLRATPGLRVGAPLIVEREPLSDYYEVSSTATTSPRGSEVELKLTRELGGNRIRLSGSYPLGARRWKGSVALEDPARYAVTAFREALARRGVGVAGGLETSAEPLPEPRRVLARFEGPPLARIVREINKESVNLHAELLLRRLGLALRGEGSGEAGREALEAFLQRSGVPIGDWAIRDGSGLSEANLVTAEGLVALLAAMDRHPKAEVFRQSLPAAGVDGTLEHRFRSPAVRSRIRAKTGTLAHVHGLAGYATRGGGERLAFAILLNHYPGERGMRGVDRIAAALLW